MFWEIKSVIQFASSFLQVQTQRETHVCMNTPSVISRLTRSRKSAGVRPSCLHIAIAMRICWANHLRSITFAAIIFARTKVRAANCRAKIIASNCCEQCQWNLLVVRLRFLPGPLSKVECLCSLVLIAVSKSTKLITPFLAFDWSTRSLLEAHAEL